MYYKAGVCLEIDVQAWLVAFTQTINIISAVGFSADLQRKLLVYVRRAVKYRSALIFKDDPAALPLRDAVARNFPVRRAALS